MLIIYNEGIIGVISTSNGAYSCKRELILHHLSFDGSTDPIADMNNNGCLYVISMQTMFKVAIYISECCVSELSFYHVRISVPLDALLFM